MDPGDVARDSGPDGGTADDVAFSVSERSDADDVVLAVLSLALDRAARVSHAPTDAPVAETKVPVLVQLRPFLPAIFVFPDSGSNSLELFIPLVGGALHGETPPRNVAELTFVIFALIR